MLIATLNMNGRASPALGPGPLSKWTTIQRLIRNRKISILCLQETHLTAEHVTQLHRLFGRRLSIISSHSTTNPTASAGTAFVINKELLAPTRTQHVEHVPGRASSLSLTWADDHSLTITNVYAPNSPHAHAAFWDSIQTDLESKSIRPDILLGDFNIVEDALDRSPPHADHLPAVDTLRILRESINVQDTWRHENPNTRLYTYSSTSNAHSLSRLDRIYTKPSMSRLLLDWSTEIPNVPTDHKLVLVRYAPPRLPYLGRGRWTWPLGLLSNKPLLQEISTRGLELQTALENPQIPPRSPQQLWTEFKTNITSVARQTAKTHVPKMTNRIKALQRDIDSLSNPDAETGPSQDDRRNITILEAEIRHLTAKINKNELARSQAKWHDKGETINKYWMSTQKTRRPRDLIYTLANPETGGHSTKTSEMAHIASTYHDNLQRADLLPPEDPTRQEAQTLVLGEVSPERHFNDPTSPLHDLITEHQILQAMKTSKNGTATGLDGIPYELWKATIEYHDTQKRLQRPAFDLIKCLRVVYNDIQSNGMDSTTGFSNGWMCPIYKKKDRSRIENYRPITLLNTDYKIFTKILATQLAQQACHLLHPDQTGFVPSRSVFDPIRLAETMCEYAEYMEENGAIIALDQEKAYDKIDHKYLFDTLRTFRLPDLFIKTVESLYANALTQVAINGVLSTPYRVTRGVRQGDPLSCLLFNLAIEPLAASLRNDPNLSGFTVPGSPQKILVNLYADDTTIYLSESDTYATVQTLLSRWCRASGAKFNVEKTEIVPIGTPGHRERVLTSRKIHPDDQPIPEAIKIAPDGQPIRVLGAWIGNNVNDAQPWSTTLDKIKLSLDQWSTARPTLDAKRLIVQLTIGGMTQFLTKAQGMPPETLVTLNRLMRDFIWDGKRPAISLDRLCSPKEEGGIGLLNLEARNLAIEATWLKAYLNLSPTRPSWAFLTDAIINCIKPSGIRSPRDVNIFLTSIRPSLRRSPNRPQPPLRASRLLQTAKKIGLSFAPLKMSRRLQHQLPAWYHIGVPPRLFQVQAATCLLITHRIRTVKSLLKVSKRYFRHDSGHSPDPHCDCKYCRRDHEIGCINPHKCSLLARDIIGDMPPKFNPYIRPAKDNLSLTHHRKEKNARAIVIAGDELLFDPSVTVRNNITDCLRVFVDPAQVAIEPAFRLQNPRPGDPLQPLLVIYTDGSCLHNGRANAASGAGTWVSEGHHLNAAIRVPGTSQTNQTGELAAIVSALQRAPHLTPLKLITDSKYVIDGLTKHLNTWEDNGWTNIQNADWFRAAAYQLRLRGAPTLFQWTKGHAGNPGNEAADQLASTGARKAEQDRINTHVPPDFSLPGLKLTTLTQRLAYLAISKQKTTPLTRTAQRNLNDSRQAIHDLCDNLELDTTIWSSTRHPDIRRPIQSFLYRAIHGSLRVGDFWTHIPAHRIRAYCSLCGGDTVDSLEHILLRCQSPERTTVWSLTSALWPQTHGDWPQPTLGTIMGCGAIKPPPPVDNTPPTPTARGKARLLRILISEAAHLIWAIRCERVIGEHPLTPATIGSRWLNKINHRLSVDRSLARLPHRPLAPTRLFYTWNPILTQYDTIPPHWATSPEVLVGIMLPRTPD